MTLSTKSTTTSELPLRCCTTTLTMAYHHSHSRMLYLLPLLFLLLPHPCITAASWIIASLDYHCLFGPQPLFGLPRYFWITAVSTYQTKQSVTPISAFLPWKLSIWPFCAIWWPLMCDPSPPHLPCQHGWCFQSFMKENPWLNLKPYHFFSFFSRYFYSFSCHRPFWPFCPILPAPMGDPSPPPPPTISFGSDEPIWPKEIISTCIS